MASRISIREQLEAREQGFLSSYAVLSSQSQGREEAEKEDPYRTVFQRDRDRIIHCKAFRRLKRKTQVFLAPRGDHYRTRLTHTLEVSQIARTLARALFLNEDLTEAIAMGHDLGHTPFGHAGERVLNELYPEGFRHSEQSLRVVDHLESRSHAPGLNLTLEVREGIRYHSETKALLYGKPLRKITSREGVLVSIADAIAYINHDIDDALRAKVISLEDLPKEATAILGATTSDRIDRMVVGLIEASREGHIDLLPEVREAMVQLREYLYQEVYPCQAINAEIARAENLLRALYQHLIEHPTEEILAANPEDSLERRTVDFVAGMTDEYALQLFDHLLLPAPWKR